MQKNVKFKKPEKPAKFYLVPKIFNGILAGMIGVTLTVPMEIILLHQTNRLNNSCEKFLGKYQGCIGFTLKSEGYYGIHRVFINLFLVAPEKALKLTANDFFVYKFTTSDNRLLVSKQMAAGGLAGIVQIVLTTPGEHLKLHIEKADRAVCRAKLVGINIPSANAVKMAWHLFNIKTLIKIYKGSFPLMVRDGFFSVIYFPLYAFFYEKYSSYYEKKSLYYHLNEQEEKRKHFYHKKYKLKSAFLTASLAGMIAAFLSTPLNVAKDEITFSLKNDRIFSGIFDCLFKTYENNGIKGLFKHASCRSFAIGLLFGLTQSIYSWGVAERLFDISDN